jgi:transcriptional regulator with XRE-family HTH domain
MKLTFKEWRETQLGLSVDEFAERFKLEKAIIIGFETGRRLPDLLLFARLSRELPAAPKFLLDLFCPLT